MAQVLWINRVCRSFTIYPEGTGLQLVSIALMYEMCRIQKLKENDLGKVNNIVSRNVIMTLQPETIQSCFANFFFFCNTC